MVVILEACVLSPRESRPAALAAAAGRDAGLGSLGLAGRVAGTNREVIVVEPPGDMGLPVFRLWGGGAGAGKGPTVDKFCRRF